MTTTINGKTPEEIKKGLECCAYVNAPCEGCPFRTDISCECIQHMSKCAITYIQQLELMVKPNEQVRWERDVAIDQLRQLGVGFGEKVYAQIPKWISVEERLPNDHGNFITKIHCDVGDWIEVDTFDHTEKKWWHDACYRTEEATEFVTHWIPMPIPEPPIVMATKGGDDYDIG